MFGLLIEGVQAFVKYWKQGFMSEVLPPLFLAACLLTLSELITRHILNQRLHGTLAYIRLVGTCTLLSGIWTVLLPGTLPIIGNFKMLATDLTFETSLKLAGLSLGVAACLIPLAVLWTKMQSRIVITTYIVLCSSLYAVALLAAASWGLDIRLPISLTAVFGLAFCLLVIAIPSMDDADKEKTHDFEGLHT